MNHERPEIVVVETYAPVQDMRYMATFGDYDLDCTVGTGPTPLDAIVDLLDQTDD